MLMPMSRRAVVAVIIAWTIASCLAMAAQEKPVASVASNFEGATSLESWRFSSGADSPSARGTLELGPGHSGSGAVLNYQIPCGDGTNCRGSVSAVWRPGSAIQVGGRTAITLWIRFAANVDVVIQCKDVGGRSTEFLIPVATLEQPRVGEWRHAVIPIAEGPNRVKGRIAELSVTVQARAPVTGALSIDDLRVGDVSEVFELRPDAPVNPPTAGAERLAPRLGVNIHVLNDNGALDRAREAGFSFVRMDMFWADVERKGRYRFDGYDELLAALEARGMSALWILDYGHPDHGGETPRTVQDVAAFGRFAAAAAAHFRGRAVRYEIWNEPNTPQFWKPAPSGAEYAALLRTAVAAMRVVDPAAVISSGGVSRFDGKFLSEVLTADLAAQLDAIGIHPYRDTAPESVAEEWALVSEWANRVFGARPVIWNTEWGYSSVDTTRGEPQSGHSAAGRHRQAVLAVRELLTVWILGMPLAVWYGLRDDSPDRADPEKNYGLLDARGNDKPAMKALLTLMDAAKGRTFVGMVRETPAGIHAMRLDGATDTVMVIWSDRPRQQTVATSKPGMLSATTQMGEVLKTKEKPPRFVQWVLQDTLGPVYLRWERVTTAIQH